MKNEEFGKLIKALRKQKTILTSTGSHQFWTQKTLAEKSGLHPKTISDIERGQVTNLNSKNHLEPLAKAFSLTEAQAIEFYAVAAGYVYPDNKRNLDKKVMRELLQQLPFPASIRTSLWDFLAINHYHYVLYGYEPETIEMMKKGELGSNLLRVLFDIDLGLRVFTGKSLTEEEWERERVRDLQAFRAASFPYIATDRFSQIIEGAKRYPDFEKLWERSQHLPPLIGVAVRPTIMLEHPDFGEMSFISLRVPQGYLGQDIQMSVYAPLGSSFDNYRRFAKSVTKKVVHFFIE